MALTSPGVQVTIIDESQYIPASTNTVPYILLATASNKKTGAGVGVAEGTLAVNANKVYLLTSQRDLLATYGNPLFYTTSAGTPINGYELNEYGLLAAYSALGITNRCYVQRVDIDLSELTATLTRPLGNPNNGTYWLDTANTTWGIFEWNQVTTAFTNQVPTVITDSAYLEPGYTTPLQSFGSIGNYAVTATSIYNPIYYKRGGPTDLDTTATELSDLYNSWVLVGSDDWRTSFPTVSGANAPAVLGAGNIITINDTDITVPAAPNNTVPGLANAINAAHITGVYAATMGGKLFLYGNSTANVTSIEGVINITSATGNLLETLGIQSIVYPVPQFVASPSYQVPRWRTTDTVPGPTGSTWLKTNNVNLGAHFIVKKFNSALASFVQQACPVYTTDGTAIYGLDASGGGKNIPVGTTYAQVDPFNNATAGYEIFSRLATGPTTVTGSTLTPGPFVSGWTFNVAGSNVGSSGYTTGTAILTGTTPSDFIAAISSADVPYVSASISGTGAIVITHTAGGSIVLQDVTGTAVSNAGFTTSTVGAKPYYLDGVVAGVELSNWVTTPLFTYTASSTAPDQDPANGRLWYYSAFNQADIMIQNNGAWFGYQTVTNDVRGNNLTLTNASGPIFSISAPTTQNNTAQSPLQYGDLWINLSNLDTYPQISRWSLINGQAQWVLIDNADHTTENGILFADARWASNGTTNPITDPIPSITSLLTSNYLDLDAPDPALYPQGTLLFNTRRSGFNVKSFQVNYFNGVSFPVPQWTSSTTYAVGTKVLYNGKIYVATASSLNKVPTNALFWTPITTNAWVTASQNNSDGTPNMGRHAQRVLVVKALKSGVDTSATAREEQLDFTLVSCPQYPELGVNLVALNDERSNTGFVISDTPLRMTPKNIVAFANGTTDDSIEDNEILQIGNQYAGVFYPSCQTSDLGGNLVVQPPSHMMLRTIIHNDQVAYPWLAPAGTRRGIVDNAIRIGYIDAASGSFVNLSVNQGIRDVLYQNRINPITFIPGVGIVNFGNKTTTSITSALDRINVARLVAFIRGRLELIGKQYLFEPNDQITRDQFANAVNSLMIDIVAKRGIYDYLIVCDQTNNTPARIDRNELWLDLAIEPVKAVEFIYIPVRILNTGALSSTS